MIVSRRSLLILLAAALTPDSAHAERRLMTGVNLAGLEFNSSRLPGERDRDFVSPGSEQLDYYRSRGANTVRVPFLWERLQPELDGGLDERYWGLLETLIRAAGERGMTLVLDAHQFGRRQIGAARSAIIGQDDGVTVHHFSSFWSLLANRLRTERHVIFNLLNEPHDQDLARLVELQNETIAAIRRVGAGQLILVSGGAWSGAHSWLSSGNSEAMLDIVDPGANFGFDVHQYLDADSSGTHSECARASGGRLAPFTTWARDHGRIGFLGEFGASAAAACQTELVSLLQHIRDNRDVWLGWTWWAGGPWWPDDYPLNIEPRALDRPNDRPQMAVLRRFFE